MSTAPRGMSVQEGYRLYREQALFVNRRYQRKLVWTKDEKARLIDSILKGYPIPLILFAELSRTADHPGKYEIIDGVQRLNAIFSFIENAFDANGLYFDVAEFARAKQLAADNIFSIAPSDASRLSRKDCADFLDYQLAVTVYTSNGQGQVTDVFGRINSGGKQLSDQEKRQAGLLNPFATLVRQLAAEIRGDTSKDILALSDMPEISIDSRRARQNYGLTAEDTFWCKQGILNNSQLRESDDEEILADIAASILFNEPIARSRELLDELYTPGSESFTKVENALAVYSADRLATHIKSVFSVLRETIETCSTDKNKLRAVVNPGAGNPIKGAFYAIFMTFFDLIVKHDRSPGDPGAIVNAMTNLQGQMTRTAHYATTSDRSNDIAKTTGLLQRYFVRRESPALGHGPGLAIDFENSLRRSHIETALYECKQGLLRLHGDREYEPGLVQRIIETICAMANAGPDGDGFIFIGVADNEQDAKRISQLDSITPAKVAQRYVVGVDREASFLKTKLERYVDKFVNEIRASDLSDPLKVEVLSKLDVFAFQNKTVIRIKVPAQQRVSFLGNEAFGRHTSRTVKLGAKEVSALTEVFSRR